MLAASLAMQVATRKVLGASWDRLPVAELALNRGECYSAEHGRQGVEESPPEQVQLPKQPLEGALEEEEERQTAEGRAPEAPPLVAAPLQVALSLGT